VNNQISRVLSISLVAAYRYTTYYVPYYYTECETSTRIYATDRRAQTRAKSHIIYKCIIQCHVLESFPLGSFNIKAYYCRRRRHPLYRRGNQITLVYTAAAVRGGILRALSVLCSHHTNDRAALWNSN